MSEFEREQDDRINIDDQSIGNQPLADSSYYNNIKDQLSALSTSPADTPKDRTVESIMDEYLNEQIPKAKSFVLTPAMNQIVPGGHLTLNDRILDQYSDMIELKAKMLLQDVLKVILKKEQKWDKSYETLDQQQLYTQLSDEDQIRFHKIFKATEEWRIEHINLFKQENQAQLEQQILNKLKLSFAQNFNIDAQDRSLENVRRTGQALDQLYQDVNIPRNAASLLLYNSSAKDNGVTKDNQEIFTVDNSQILGSYIGKAMQETLYEGQDPGKQKKDLLAMVEQSKENVQEFASRANYILEAYGIVNKALDTVRLENNKMPDQIKLHEIVKSFMPAVLKFSPEVLHENQATLSRQLANDLNKAIKFFSLGQKLKIDQDKLDKIATKISNYKVEEVVAESRDEVKTQTFSADSAKESVTRNSGELPNTQDKSQDRSPTTMRTFSVSNNVLDKLVNKYQELENGVKKTYIDPKMRKKEINVLNNELYQLTTEEGIRLPINQLSAPLENLSIKELQTQAGVKYSTIGNPPSNGLLMGQAADGQFYFTDISSNSQFTGLVFVERIDENTGQLLAVKDVICYSEGKVVKFIEALDGKSRLGQLEKFKQLSSSPILEQTVNEQKTSPQQERSELPPTSSLSKATQSNQEVTSDLSKGESSKNDRSKSGYVVNGTEWLVEGILEDSISKTKLKDKRKIEEIKEFVRQELNEYAAASREQATNIEEILFATGMAERRGNFTKFISNELVNNQGNLKEGILVDKMATFYKNVSEDHIMGQDVRRFDSAASKKLSDNELHFIVEGLENNNELITANKLKLVQDYGDYNVFVDEMAKIIENRQANPKGENILSVAELRNLNLKDPTQLNLLENTIKVIDKYDAKGLRDAIMQSIIVQNSNVALQENLNIIEPRQDTEKPILEKPVINVLPPMPKTPKLAEQERYADSKLMKGNRLTPNLNQALNTSEQNRDQTTAAETRSTAQNVPPFSTFKPLDAKTTNVEQGQPSSPRVGETARVERKPAFDIPNSIEEAKTPEQVRQFVDYQQKLGREEERLAAQKDQAKFISAQRNKVVTPEIQDPASMEAESRRKARNESGYVIRGTDDVAQDILKETIEKIKLKDPKKITELKEFIRQELNEYSASGRGEAVGNMMDMIFIPDMAARKQNFISFISNELVNNKDNLKDGVLVDKMAYFYKNVSQDHTTGQDVRNFDSKANKKLSDPEFKYVLEALDKDKGIVTTNKLRLMQEHGDYKIFTQEVEKLIQKNHMTSERDGILSTAELQNLNLQDPAHIKILEDTVKKIENYDNKGVRDAIKQSIVANNNEINKDLQETGAPNQTFENSSFKTSQNNLTPPPSLKTPKVTEQEKNAGMNLTTGNRFSGLDSLSSRSDLQDKSYGMTSTETEFSKTARNKPGYAISELEPLAQDILREIVSKVQLKEQNKIGEIREFIRQELNEYVSKNDNNAHHLMETVSLPEMTGRKQNFMNFVFNELVNNQDNLKEGMLAGKIESFYRNVSQDHIGEQVVSKFDKKAKTKLSVSELYDVLEGLDQGDKIITDNKLNLMRDHGDYNAFVQGITKVMQNNNLDPKVDNILSADKLKTLNLRSPEHLKMLENTMKVIENRDIIGVLDAVKQSIITANTNPLAQSILEETVSKAKLKDKKQIGALKEVIGRELNEYVNKSGAQINNVMDMVLIPKMEGRKQNFISFISNELVFDKDNLKEGSLANKMESFYRNVSQERGVNQVKGNFDPKTSRKLSTPELKDVLEGLDQDNKRITDNKLKLLQDHGDYNVFVQEVAKIIQKNHITPQKDNILSLDELKILSLQDSSHLKLLENTIKGIEKYDNRGVRDAISKSIAAENDKIVNQEKSKSEPKQAPGKTILEKPVIKPPLPRTPKIAEQERYAGSKLMKGNRLTQNLNQTINPRDQSMEQSNDQPSAPEVRAAVQNVPPFSTFRPLDAKTASGSEQSNSQPKSPSISNDRKQSLDKPETIDEAKTPEQVRQFIDRMQQESIDQEKQALQKARAEFLRSQRKKVKTPEAQDPAHMEAESRRKARNESGYVIRGTEEVAQDILKEAIAKTNLKDKKKIGELKEFIRQELNEYSASGRGEAVGNMMDMIFLPDMEGRRQNFASFISNEIVNNKDNLKEGGLVDRMQLFYKNLSKDHTGQQTISKFEAKSSKKLNENELEYVLDALDNNTKELPFNRLNLVKEHGDYNVFVQEVTKIIKDNNLKPKADNILSVAELQNLDLKNPDHLNLLENTIKTIEKRDANGLRTAIKLSLMKEHVGDFDSTQLNTNNIQSKPPSSRDNDVPGR